MAIKPSIESTCSLHYFVGSCSWHLQLQKTTPFTSPATISWHVFCVLGERSVVQQRRMRAYFGGCIRLLHMWKMWSVFLLYYIYKQLHLYLQSILSCSEDEMSILDSSKLPSIYRNNIRKSIFNGLVFRPFYKMWDVLWLFAVLFYKRTILLTD
jgi:hypothetical protein